MNNSNTPTPADGQYPLRGTGIMLMIATLVGVLVLSHHPGLAYRELVLGGEAAARLSSAAAQVHGILMVLLLIWYYCLVEFAVQRGLRRPSVRIGLIAYSVGLIAMLGAATIDGFVVARIPVSIAAMASAGVLGEPSVVRQVLVLAFALNQALANIGSVGMSLGIAAWSILLLRGATFEKAVAVVGLLIGAITSPVLLTGMLSLNRHGILVVIAAQALWNLGIGVLLLRRRAVNAQP
jgi:hypothetical protein